MELKGKVDLKINSFYFMHEQKKSAENSQECHAKMPALF